MNNRDFTFEVFGICEKAIVAGQGFSEVYVKVCALVKAESAPKAPNSVSLPCESWSAEYRECPVNKQMLCADKPCLLARQA